MDDTLSNQAHNELVHMADSMTAANTNVVTTETPIGRGGTQELMDAELVEFVADDGLTTTYHLTTKGRVYLQRRGLL